MNRRGFLAGLIGVAAAHPVAAHTPYGQWEAYRRKHLLIGCHREDPRTYELAQALVAEFETTLPEASARPARARTPERLASLLGTDQLEVAILSRADAEAMAAGSGRFRPYGSLPLRRLAAIRDRFLIAHGEFPIEHAALVIDAVRHGALFVGNPSESTTLEDFAL